MTRDPRLRRWLPTALLPLGVAALAAASFWDAEPSAPAAPPILLALILLAAAGAAYAPVGRRGLGLGAAALPPASFFFGPVGAGAVAALAALARELVRGWSPSRLPDRGQRLARVATRLGSALLAALAAARVWELAAGGALAVATAAAAGVGSYLACQLALELAAGHLSGRPVAWTSVLASLAFDLGGCLVGLVLVRVATGSGWATALALHAALALLAVEATRSAWLRLQAERRVDELQRIAQAGHRIIFRNPDLLGIAEQIHLECRQVLPFEWFQFELLSEEGGGRSWTAGPERRVREGTPLPPATPPTLPGIHRRSGWRVIERKFGTDDELVARLKLWCDPRRLDPPALELLDSLLPQMASSVQRALLDRVAKRDPLTDLPDRRAFESHLERVFKSSRREGAAMAVILCDVDNFKRINDLNGHAVGDQALLVVSRLMESQSREEDFCCRLGGDEFAAVLERADGETALAIAERIRAAVARRKRSDFKTRIPLRLTAGVAAFPELPVREASELVELADEAMYEAKRRGRNRCLLHCGRGRYREPGGEVVGDAETPEIEPPTLFA